MTTDSRRQEVIAAIAAHVSAHGERDWVAVQEQFPELPAATFWRYLRAWRSSRGPDARLASARQELAVYVEGRDAAPPATELTKGWRVLDLPAKLLELFEDIEVLRKMAKDADGGVGHPHWLSVAIGHRDRSIHTALRCGEALMSVTMQMDFFDLLVAEVAAESPEVAGRIIDRLRALQDPSIGR